MKLGLEPCNRYETHLLNTASQTQALLDRLGEDPTSSSISTPITRISRKRISARRSPMAAASSRYVHLSESDRGVPGSGNVAWKEVFTALKAARFEGDLVVELFVNMMPEIASALSVWRPVARSREEVLEIGVPFLKSAARAAGLIA